MVTIDPDRLKRVHVVNVSVRGDGDKLRATIHLEDEREVPAGIISWERWVDSGSATEARRRIRE